MYTLALLLTILFVPLDDRPVTQQLPEMLGRIAGIHVIEPPKQLLGNYLVPGNPDAIIGWLNAAKTSPRESYVISSDMLAYGGLVASRIPATSYQDARTRLREFAQLRRAHPLAPIAAFGTIMRLAPTGVPAIGDAEQFFAAYPIWTYLQEYANLHDPPLPSETERAEQLRAAIGEPVLSAYIGARTRNYGIDLSLIQQTGTGTIDTLVLGQDDAGVTGLHVKDVRALEQAAGPNVFIEPGADELGMVLVARALAHSVHWIPRIAIRYFGTGLQDPREFAPIPQTIDHLITVCGAIPDDVNPDIILYVRLPNETGGTHPSDMQLLDSIRTDENAHRSVAFADLTFLENTSTAQAAFAQQLLQSGIASRLDAYASWNTNANTVGTALAEAISANTGRRNGTYDALAHREFTFMRFLDDYVFHDIVRPQVNAMLDARGIIDHTYLLPEIARVAEQQNTFLLAQRAPGLLAQLYPGYHIAALQIRLPWDRTFETSIDVGLAPGLARAVFSALPEKKRL